ncbi:hypothetical protein Nepgr_018706 [Nepenthes gracilis]|uniref:Uncharacterized protein n=1 Tax=Nepenthes gracilis TaxID=150966 RepID=A0AAD3SRY8_NEPGR|nr:hypothetical protein Nepgr_018706 [Nepenthes gracilis]
MHWFENAVEGYSIWRDIAVALKHFDVDRKKTPYMLYLAAAPNQLDVMVEVDSCDGQCDNGFLSFFVLWSLKFSGDLLLEVEYYDGMQLPSGFTDEGLMCPFLRPMLFFRS